MMADPVLSVENLNVVYDTSSGPAPAVNQVSFTLRPGERLGLIGESGSGKTTMATALLRLTRAPGRIAGGKVILSGRDIMALSQRDLRAVRLRDIAMIPQGAMSSLNPVLRIRVQIEDAILAHEPGVKKAAMAERIANLMVRVGLEPSVADRYPHELSGGMKQRTVMAIATSLSPKVIVADEPTSALDVVVQRQVMQTLGRLQSGPCRGRSGQRRHQGRIVTGPKSASPAAAPRRQGRSSVRPRRSPWATARSQSPSPCAVSSRR